VNDDSRDSSASPVAGVPAELPPEGIAPEQFGLPLLAGLLEHSLEGIVICDAARRYIYLNRAAYEITGRTPEQLIGRDVLTPLAPRVHDALLAGFALSLSGQTGKRGTIVLRPDGSEREIEYSTMRLTVGGQPVVAAILHDVTELHRQTREARALARIAAGLTVDQSMSATLDTLALIVVEETAAEACIFVLIEDDSTRYRLVGGHGFAPGFAAAFNSTGAHARGTATVRAFQTGKTQKFPDARSRTLANPNFAALHPYIQDVTWEALAAVPLIYRGRALGSLNAYFPAGQPDERELASLEAIAHQAAVAVENANLYFEAQQKAALEERQRLARELHDSVSQALYGIALGARTARTMLERYPDQPERAAEPLDYLLSLSEAGLAELRALIDRNSGA
jgi:PAS domain S-box-containing protein